VQRLLGQALDSDAPDHVALAAIRDALDRAGLGAKQAVGVEAELKPYERVLESVTGLATISRAESRERRGLRATPAPADPPEPMEVVDAEVVDPPGSPPAGRPGGRRPAEPSRGP